jgi:diguanylate cyclase (GGDEF)-like protein
MDRRFVYAVTGGLLSAGAPLGLLAVRLARRRYRSLRHRPTSEVAADRAGFLYVGTSTAVVFSVFGYILGRQADRLTELSETDALTGLRNVRGLYERLDQELARFRRYGEPLALLAVDLDGLKTINDEHGHRGGDVAIRTVADVIRSELRETDLGARWGGDEFAILAPNASAAAATALAERIRRSISSNTDSFPLTVSIGVATLASTATTPEIDTAALMRIADQALYEAKKCGRNRVVVSEVDNAAL